MGSFSPISHKRLTSKSPFDAIRRVDFEPIHGEFEWWSARELQPLLGYDRWKSFNDATERAKASCRNSGNDPSDHFRGVAKMIELGKGRVRNIDDVQLTRFGCYLVAMNGDPRKAEIAAAQQYFAVQTYRAEQQLSPHSSTQPAVIREPEVARPWAERFRQSFSRHLQHVNSTWAVGSFSVVTAGIMEMLILEDELIRHMLSVKPGDRPCISLGKRWSSYRRERGKSDVESESPLLLPEQGFPVPVKVYPSGERTDFQIWMYSIYLPCHLIDYIDNKKEWKKFDKLPRASVADNTCLTLTGQQAIIDSKRRVALNSADGFIPALSSFGTISSGQVAVV